MGVSDRLPPRPLRHLLRCLIGLLFCSAAIAGFAEKGPVSGVLTGASRQLLGAAVGNPDAALPNQLMTRLGPQQMVAAFYEGTRVERLVALDAAAAADEDPFFVCASLAALMGARDRAVAGRAARALDAILVRRMQRPDGFEELVPGQADQLISQLAAVAGDRRLDADVRGIALSSAERLSAAGSGLATELLLTLLEDSEPVVRRQAVTLFDVPLDQTVLTRLAELVSADPDLFLRGVSAGVLCENALFHGAESPSDDLTAVLKGILETPGMPVAAMGGILACLSCMEGEARQSLVDIAIAHPDPAVGHYWKSLQAGGD